MRKGWTPERAELQRQVMRRLNANKEFQRKRKEGQKAWMDVPENAAKVRNGAKLKHKDPAYVSKYKEAIKFYYAEFRGGYVPEHYWEEYQKLRKDGFSAKEAYEIIKKHINKPGD